LMFIVIEGSLTVFMSLVFFFVKQLAYYYLFGNETVISRKVLKTNDCDLFDLCL
jgi:hypothetical protein